MEEGQRSAVLVDLPDMSESLSDGTEDSQQPTQPASRRSARINASTLVVAQDEVDQQQEVQATVHPVAVAANVAVQAGTVQAVPVSLPVGSIIGVANGTNGATTFNVITSDQLQIPTSGQFKQMLCVDNGFICETRDDKIDHVRWNGELKATHIVIQNNADDSESDPINTSSVTTNSMNASWTECANLAVLPVRCKTTNAELHKNRFGSGGRGRCIKMANQWYTPSEFEALCGRASSKDWKRSIRFGGRSLQTLIDEGILLPHATSCTCSACCDDDNAAGPIRLFTPYKRRRRARDPIDGEPPLQKFRDGSGDASNNEDSEGELITDKNCWSSFVQSEDVVQQAPESDSITSQTENGIADNKFQKLEEMSNKLMKVAYEFKKIIEEFKSEERKLKKKEQSLVTRIESKEVIETVALQPAADAHTKKCANCDRDAMAECSLCRRTPYCSTFCQRKDWAVHQVECVRDATETVMLIVESSSGTAATALAAAQTRNP